MSDTTDCVGVIVTSAGTASAISVIKSLKSQDEIKVCVIAVDMDYLAPGLYLADHYRIVPKFSDPKYLDQIVAITNEFDFKEWVLLPIYSKEIESLAEKSEFLLTKGIKTFLPAPNIIKLCNDKFRMNDFILGLGLKTPRTYTREEIASLSQAELPLFVKPNTGSSSIGTKRIDTIEELQLLKVLNEDMIVQECIEGEEITIDVFCNANFEAIVISPRHRMATKSGQMIKGRTIDATLFTNAVEVICKNLPYKGACNIQFFKRNDEIVFLEMNPRFAAGGLMLTVKAGANIPLILVKNALSIEVESNECKVKPNILMTRYWEEIFIDEN